MNRIRDHCQRSSKPLVAPVVISCRYRCLALFLSRGLCPSLSIDDSPDLFFRARQLRFDIGEILDHFGLSFANPREKELSITPIITRSTRAPMEIGAEVSVEMNRVPSAPCSSVGCIARQCCINQRNCANCNHSLRTSVPAFFFASERIPFPRIKISDAPHLSLARQLFPNRCHALLFKTQGKFGDSRGIRARRRNAALEFSPAFSE